MYHRYLYGSLVPCTLLPTDGPAPGIAGLDCGGEGMGEGSMEARSHCSMRAACVRTFCSPTLQLRYGRKEPANAIIGQWYDSSLFSDPQPDCQAATCCGDPTYWRFVQGRRGDNRSLQRGLNTPRMQPSPTLVSSVCLTQQLGKGTVRTFQNSAVRLHACSWRSAVYVPPRRMHDNAVPT